MKYKLFSSQRELQLEDTQSRLQQQYRDIMAIDRKLRSNAACFRVKFDVVVT